MSFYEMRMTRVLIVLLSITGLMGQSYAQEVPPCSQSAQDYRRQGDAASNEKRWADALAAYEKARPGFEKDYKFLNNLATAHYYLAVEKTDALRHYGEARKLYEIATGLKPDDALLWGSLGGACVGMGELVIEPAARKSSYESGIAAYRKSISLAANDSWIHRSLGQALASLGRFPEAEASLREALRLKPGMDTFLNDLGKLFVLQQKWAEAEVAYRDAFRSNRNVAIFPYNVGVSLVKQGKREEAKPFVQEARRLGVKNTPLIEQLGLTNVPIPTAPLALSGDAAPASKKLIFKTGGQLLNALLEMQKNIEDPRFKKLSTASLKSILSDVENLENKESNKTVREVSAIGLKDGLLIFSTLFLRKQEVALTSLITLNTFSKVAERPADSLEMLLREVRTLKANFKLPEESKETTPLEFALQDIEQQRKTLPDKERGQVEKALKDLLQVLRDAAQVSGAASEWAASQAAK